MTAEAAKSEDGRQLHYQGLSTSHPSGPNPTAADGGGDPLQPAALEQAAALGMPPSLLRQASVETRDAIRKVLSGEPSSTQRSTLRVITDARLAQDQLALRTGGRHSLLRAVQDGASVDDLRARLAQLLDEQRTADNKSFEASAVPVWCVAS